MEPRAAQGLLGAKEGLGLPAGLSLAIGWKGAA